MYSEVFPTRLKKARENYGYTQEELACEIGISRSTIANYEKGFREPDFETLAIIAHHLGVTSDWLIGLSPDGENISIKERIIENRNRAEMLKKIEREAARAQKLVVN